MKIDAHGVEEEFVVEEVEYHRNGVGGAGFHVVKFTAEGPWDLTPRPMVGVVFEAEAHVAVFNRERLGVGEIGFGANSWRGDVYEPHLRAAIKADEERRYGADEEGVTT